MFPPPRLGWPRGSQLYTNGQIQSGLYFPGPPPFESSNYWSPSDPGGHLIRHASGTSYKRISMVSNQQQNSKAMTHNGLIGMRELQKGEETL